MNQALLVVSAGSREEQARSGALACVERALQSAVPELPFYRAYTSPAVRRILAEQGAAIPSLSEALEQMLQDGVQNPRIVPTHLLPGIEYGRVRKTAEEYTARFSTLRLSGPLLGTPQNLLRFSRVLMSLCPPQAGESTVFMGHGTAHFAGLAYPALQTMFSMAGRPDLQVAVLEGWPALEDILPRLTTRRVTLRPLMLTAGKHVQTDMAGPAPDSWSSRLAAAGFEPRPILRGLGEFPEICALYVSQLASIR